MSNLLLLTVTLYFFFFIFLHFLFDIKGNRELDLGWERDGGRKGG